jgi:sugar phosphate isomerase/epimerase
MKRGIQPMISFGMPSLIELPTIEDQISLCNELDLDFIELNLNLPIFLPENLSAEKIRNLSKNHDIHFTLHLPEELDITSFQPSMRNGDIQRCKELIVWAKEAGIHLVNAHVQNGIFFTLPDRKIWVNEVYEKEFNSLFIESYKEIWAFAMQNEITFSVENTRNFHIPFLQRGLEQLSSLSNFAITWDVGHDARGDYQEFPFFEKHLDKLAHMHLHDYDGHSDHLPLFTGSVPILERLSVAKKQSASVVIEIKTVKALKKSVMALNEKSPQLFLPSPDQCK